MSGISGDMVFRSCAFQVAIYPEGELTPLVRAGFSECDGLEMSMEVKSLRSGGENFRQVRLVGPTSYGTLTLKRGMTSDLGLWRWFGSYAQLSGLRARAEVEVILQDLALEGGDGAERRPLARFRLYRCLPQKLKAPALNAREGVIAIEECQICYEAMRLLEPDEVDPGPPPWAALERARLVLLERFGSAGEPGARKVPERAGGGGGDLSASGELVAQFNPESLRFTYQNEIKTASGEATGDNSGGPSIQHVGAGATKLAVSLVFDVTADSTQGYGDARVWTSQIVRLITPSESGQRQGELVPPAVRFEWGRTWFEGVVESVEETLELFSADGRALRATVALSLAQQRVAEPTFDPRALPEGARPQLGTRPLTAAPSGATVQSLVQRAGGGDWAAVARSNGVENPRRLTTGVLLDLSTRKGF